MSLDDLKIVGKEMIAKESEWVVVEYREIFAVKKVGDGILNKTISKQHEIGLDKDYIFEAYGIDVRDDKG